jgi:alkanesulfonate monooxygenase SsuD/methylene tetrahydromethanopterin reductase-like flavin-dependent oxidoreductase (luciferase family)
VPVIVGGHGRRRTPALAARYADEFNVPFGSLEDTRRQYALVAEACEREGRDASGRAPLALSVAQTIVCGRTEAEIHRRADAVGRSAGLTGTPEQVAERLHAFREAGAQRAFLQFLDMKDLDHIELVAAEVAPLLA